MSKLKNLTNQTITYGLSSIIGRALNYLLVPLYTSIFLPSEYGLVTELYAYIAFLNILYVYGLETTYFRFASKKGNTYDYFNLTFTIILSSSILLSGIIWIYSEAIAQLLNYPNKGIYIKWIASIVTLDALVAIPFARLRKLGKVKRFVLFKIVNIVLNISLNIFFILFCPWVLIHYPNSFILALYSPEMGVGYIFISNLLANALYLFFFIPDWLKIRLTLNIKEAKRLIQYALPILIIGFAGVMNELFSRIILKHRLLENFYPGFTNLEILGIFGACYKLSVFMPLVVQSFRYAFEPFLFSHSKEKNSPHTFSKVMTSFALFSSFSWLVLSVFMPYYAPIFLRQDSYLIALDAVPWLLGGGIFLGIFYNLSLWYKLTDKTLYGAYISLIGAFLTFTLNWTLIPILGYMGSAITTFISYFVMVVISYLWGRKHYSIPYNLLKIGSYISLAGIGIIVNQLTKESLFKSIVISLIYLTLLIRIERKSIRQFRSKNKTIL